MRAAHGDVDYNIHGAGYANVRRADPELAAQLAAALGRSRTVLNVGAGAGNYEPADRYVLAIEPSAAVRAQRPSHLPPAIDAYAEQLPLSDKSVDAAMASIMQAGTSGGADEEDGEAKEQDNQQKQVRVRHTTLHAGRTERHTQESVALETADG